MIHLTPKKSAVNSKMSDYALDNLTCENYAEKEDESDPMLGITEIPIPAFDPPFNAAD